MRKTRFILTVVTSILLLSISISTPLFQISKASTTGTSNSLWISYNNLGVAQREMSVSELQEYKDAVGTYIEGQEYNKIVAGHGTGLSPPTESEWENIAENAYLVEQVSYQAVLPSVVDHSAEPWFPPIGSQGLQGACASFAVGYYCKTYQEAKEHEWNLAEALWTGDYNNGNISLAYQSQVMSPAFIYNLINGGEDDGSNLETSIRLVSNVGICSWAEMPYYWQDFTRWPTETAWMEAPMYRCNSTYDYQYLYSNTSQGVESLKNWLAADNLAVISVDATDNLWNYTTNSIVLNSQDILTEDSYIIGPLDHAATIVGYDDQYNYTENGVTHYGAFKIANSWGVGGWENIPDGCYWISYAAIQKMSTSGNPAILFQDLTDYQPEIRATFNITHSVSGDCDITFGLGTPSSPIVTKEFTEYIFGGDQAFCTYNVVFDLSEFKRYLTSPYNQPFFMTIYDGGTPATGTVNYFAIEDTNSSQTPVNTRNRNTVSLTLTHSFAEAYLSVSPTSGPPNGEVTITGSGFSGSPVSISYYNPITLQWVTIIENYTTSSNFGYIINVPDLQQFNPQGDSTPASDNILFRVQDGAKSYNTSYTQYRRGIIQISNQIANGMFGNNTDLSTEVFVQNGQLFEIIGKWFSPGTAEILLDNQSVGSTTINETGFFNKTVTMPATTAGQHYLTVVDETSNITITITRLPIVNNNYTDIWHTQDFIISLTPDYNMTETYYRINDGQTQTISANGQPMITIEGSNNKLEYWSIWNIYGSGNMEISQTNLTGIKLDKNGPTASLQINGGSTYTTSNIVTLTLSASDSASGIKQVRYSNGDTWDQVVWESFAPSKNWVLSNSLGIKTVYCQIQDNAGQITKVSDIITLTSPQLQATQSSTPTASPTAEPTIKPNPTSTPTVPEYNTQLFILLLAMLTASTLIAVCFKKKRKL